MKDLPSKSPFKPGPGTIPKYAPGREREKEIIAEALEEISSKNITKGLLPETPMAPIQIVGPRGVGKTLLLGFAREKAREQKIHVARFSHMTDIKSDNVLKDLHDSVAVRKKWWQRIKFLSLLFKGSGAGVALTEDATPGYKKVVEDRLKKSPIVFLLDEVQTYDAPYLSLVVQVAQQLMNDRRPLTMILAGTPELDGYLRQARVSFMVRNRDIRINLLETEAARKALSEPFAAHGVEMDDDALESMTEVADNYPYFVQLIGDAVWQEARTSQGDRIDAELVEKAKLVMQKQKNRYYQKIYDEIEGFDLMPHVHQVTDIINSRKDKRIGKEVMVEGLAARNQGMAKEEARKIINKILKEGVLWPNDEGRLCPGIPSFFDFIARRKEAFQAEREEERANRDKKAADSEYLETLPELPLGRYISDRSLDSEGQGLRVEIPLDQEDQWNPGAEKDGIYRVVMPDGERKVYRVNRIESPRHQPQGMTFEDFPGIILYLGEQTNGGFSDYGKLERSDVINWKNRESTDD